MIIKTVITKLPSFFICNWVSFYYGQF